VVVEMTPPDDMQALTALFSLAGKTALVTGGGRGLGRDFAHGLAGAGAHVLVASRKQQNCEAVVEEIRAAGGTARAVGLDVGDTGSIEALLTELDAAGERVDVLVNNAGITWGARTLEYPLAAWDKVFATNLRGLWHLTQGIARRMKSNGGGNVVMVSSVAGMGGAPDSPAATVAYSCSKAALIGLTRDLAVKLAPLGIRVNGIAPGVFLTDMFKFVKDNPVALERIREPIPLRREGGSNDLRAAIVYLASAASAYMTGHTLVIDGGMSARLT
jgi:gluconate 5-dehydrogenase